MNLAASAPAWLAICFTLVLIGAAIEDVWRRRISNIFPVLLIVGAATAAIVVGIVPGVWQNLALFGLILVAGTALFAARLFGGGDVKLLASCLLWFDFASGLPAILAIALAGGVLAILALSLRPILGNLRASKSSPLRQVPYGVAIAIGAIGSRLLMR